MEKVEKVTRGECDGLCDVLCEVSGGRLIGGGGKWGRAGQT